MIARYAALVVCAAGCGKVATRSGGDAAVDGATTDAPTATSGMYRGTLDQTAAVTFGGPTGTINYCHYTITLKDLVVQIGLLPNGQVRTGQVQDTNVEATVQPCSLMPIPPGAAFYDFLSPGTAINMPLTFIGAAANVPAVSLTVELSPTDPGYQARLTFHRTDQSAPFDWTVVTTVALSTP
jgi:hypothetical protein